MLVWKQHLVKEKEKLSLCWVFYMWKFRSFSKFWKNRFQKFIHTYNAISNILLNGVLKHFEINCAHLDIIFVFLW